MLPIIFFSLHLASIAWCMKLDSVLERAVVAKKYARAAV